MTRRGSVAQGDEDPCAGGEWGFSTFSGSSAVRGWPRSIVAASVAASSTFTLARRRSQIARPINQVRTGSCRRRVVERVRGRRGRGLPGHSRAMHEQLGATFKNSHGRAAPFGEAAAGDGSDCSARRILLPALAGERACRASMSRSRLAARSAQCGGHGSWRACRDDGTATAASMATAEPHDE